MALPMWVGQEPSLATEPGWNISDLSLTEFPLNVNASAFGAVSDASTSPGAVASAINFLHVYVTPIVIIVGLVGNTMSFLVFSCSHLRRLSSSLYLCLLAVADIGYLLAFSVAWLVRVDINLFHTFGWCQGVVYVHYICGFLSVWSVVSFTTERYIIVYHPLRKDAFCSRRHAKLTLLALVFSSCALYSYIFCTQVALAMGARQVCLPDPGFGDVTMTMLSIDTFVACLIPSAVIIVLNVRLIVKIHRYQTRRAADDNRAVLLVVDSRKRRPRLHTSISTSGSMRIKFSLSPTDNSATLTPSNFVACPQRVVRNPGQFRTARMLLILSSVSVLLHLPKHAARLHFFVRDLFFKTTRVPKLEMQLNQLFNMLYFLSFAINFFIYSACGRPFRSGLVRLCRRWKYKLIKVGRWFSVRRDSTTSMRNLRTETLPVNGHIVKIKWQR